SVTGGPQRRITSLFINDPTQPCITSVAGDAPQSTINVYPNPTTGLSTISLVLNGVAPATITIITAEGSMLCTRNVEQPRADGIELLDLSDLPNGMYLVVVSQQGYSRSITVIKNV
ncbi:MAG: T9SS type A sorting domain-containing protein, partial [Candidatus Kapabacteria bacterium]|nr:T9SS type A sorting domain-containing protein [Candidatus Kapabacteria bacterium]